jgi:large subunit ribosomal protein L23
VTSLDVRQVLLAPVVSEKSYNQIDENRYTFKVHKHAHRLQVRQAVEELFGVHVLKVNMAKVPPKPKRRGMHKGRTPGWKKAVVHIRAGETIEIFGGAQV